MHITLIDENGELSRVDGGIGVSLEKPQVVMEGKLEGELEVEGVQKDLVISLAKRFLDHYKIEEGAYLKVYESIPEHVGLGSKTQLSLATATILSKFHGVKANTRELAHIMGRGGTSGIGIAAFEDGGFILDGGHSFGPDKEKQEFLPSRASKAKPAPILAKYNLPDEWYWVVTIPNVQRGASGEAEVNIFQKSCPIPSEDVEKLCRIIFMMTLPAIVERDIEVFGQSLTKMISLGFKKIEVELQRPIIKNLLNILLENGAEGVGMSSFGPTTFAITEGKKQAENLMKTASGLLTEKEISGKFFITPTRNKGALIEEL
jgi:beta-ribofuranosylaminobenzene 5'-phosphate synthase